MGALAVASERSGEFADTLKAYGRAWNGSQAGTKAAIMGQGVCEVAQGGGEHSGSGRQQPVEQALARPWAWWQKASLGLAVAFLALGLGLQAWAALRGADAPVPRASEQPAAVASAAAASPGPAKRRSGVNALLAGPRDVIEAVAASELVAPSRAGGGVGGAPAAELARAQTSAPPETAPEIGVAEKAAPILTESGIMFFVGFCIGAAIRALARAVIVLLGFVFLGVLVLQYAGIVPTIDWNAVAEILRTAASWAERGAARLQDVLAHTLPSGTMAGLGLATGLRRRG